MKLLSAPISFLEIVLGYVGAAATKAMFIGVIILITSFFLRQYSNCTPHRDGFCFLVLTCNQLFTILALSSAFGQRILNSCNWCHC